MIVPEESGRFFDANLGGTAGVLWLLSQFYWDKSLFLWKKYKIKLRGGQEND